jgi:DNA primase catalytic core
VLIGWGSGIKMPQAYFTQDTLDKIINSLNIVDLIGNSPKVMDFRHVSGEQYVGHTNPDSNSKASLKVNGQTGEWHDLAAGIGGRALHWVGYEAGYTDFTGRDFIEVVQLAADKAGVELNELNEQEKGAIQEWKEIKKLLTEAADTYHNNLKNKPELYEFIKNKWGLDKEIVDKYKIGYATDFKSLHKLNEITLKKSGLIKVDDREHEIFHDRITFPYWKRGEVLYFAARAMGEDVKPKYMKLMVNKQDQEYISPLVQNNAFYGEDSVIGKKECVITEGVTDCLSMLQAGFACISPVTKEFKEADTPKLIQICKRFETIYICNDNEENNVGRDGALKTAALLEKEGISVKIVILPRPEGVKKVDIAEYMKIHTAEDLKRLQEKSLSLWEFKLSLVKVPEKPVDRLRAFDNFISNDLGAMKPFEWDIFVKNDVRKCFHLNLVDIKEMIKEKRPKPKINPDKKQEVVYTDPIETDECGKILIVTPGDVEELLKISLSGTPYQWEIEEYHIEALRVKYLNNMDNFGNTIYDTGDYRTGNTGLFYYDSYRMFRTEYTEDGIPNRVFDHWRFTEEEVSPTPITVIDSALNIDSDYGEILYTMQVKNEYGDINVFTESKSSMFTKKGILGLISKNFCVIDNSKTLGQVQNYFKNLFYKNTDLIPKSLAAESTGWKADDKYFVFGNKAYTDNEVLDIHMLDSKIEQMYTPHGTIENYISGIKEAVEAFPIARFMIYGGCAAPILRILGLNSVVIFLKGDSTTGKTKLCLLGVSPFTYLTKIADSTKVYQELDAAQNDGLPIFYDEASGNEERLNSILYMLANGTGKGRGKQHGEGVVHGKTWRTVILYNGENPILTESDNVGKFVRVIEIKNPIKKSPRNKEIMDRIEKTCDENHGLLADLFLKEIFRRKDELFRMYEENLKKFEKSNDAGERLKKHFAAFAAAGEILEDIFSEIGIEKADAFEIVNELFKEVVIGRPIEEEWKRALKVVWNWTVSNEGSRVINTTSLTQTMGVNPSEVWAWITEPQTKELTISSSDRICYVPAKLKALLREHGYNPDKTIEAWAEKKLIDSTQRTDDKGNRYGKLITELNKIVTISKDETRTFKAIKLIVDNVMEELDMDFEERPELKIPEKTPLQKMKESLKIHNDLRLSHKIKDTKQSFLDSFQEQNHNKFIYADIKFVMEKMCETGELSIMP